MTFDNTGLTYIHCPFEVDQKSTQVLPVAFISPNIKAQPSAHFRYRPCGTNNCPQPSELP